MFRQILRSRKFIIGLSVLLLGVSALLLKSGKPGFAAPRQETLETRPVEYVPTPQVESTVSNEMDGLQSKIDAKIDEVISLIDAMLD